MSSCKAVTVLPDLVTETVMHVGQRYASQNVVLAVTRDSYVPRKMLPNLKDYDEQRNVIENVDATKILFSKFLLEGNSGGNKAVQVVQNSFLLIEGN